MVHNRLKARRADRQTSAQPRKSLCENLLDKMMGAPGLAFETWDPPRKCRRTRVLTHIPSGLLECG